MFNKIARIFQLIKNMGPRYLAFRVFFELKKRSGFLKVQFPMNPEIIRYTELNTWKKETDFFVKSREQYLNLDYAFEVDLEKSEKQKNGIFQFFSGNYHDLGIHYDWITNPDTKFKYDKNLHWSVVNDYDTKAGDIKYVWEKSRFSYLYLAIRADLKFKTDSSKYVFDEIISWIDANPINQGPNYKCSQEMSLRIFNWIYALQFYRNSEYLTSEVFDKIMHVLYWQMKHVYSNINFSRIAVRNNHAITETLALYLSGLMFPFFPEANTWKVKGKKWFEKEIEYQIYSDGTYLQFSMNYHRVVVQLLTLAINVAQHYNESYAKVVYNRAYQSLNFLIQCQDEKYGYLPNYGANDGALFFPFTTCEYRDYRPQLNSLHFLLTGEKLYGEGPWNEEIEMWNINSTLNIFEPLKKNLGWNIFPVGGFYIANLEQSCTFIRCGNHRDRPSQADNLHIDIWYKNHNILTDGGSYKYNSIASDLNYFFGTESHNTVMLNNLNQMEKGGRFIWYFWTQVNNVNISENSNELIFEGGISAFQYLSKKIKHNRRIIISKNNSSWQVNDTIINKPKSSTMRQLWHPIQNDGYYLSILNNTDAIIRKDGYYSSSYGQKESIEYISVESQNNSINTILKIDENTFTTPVLS
jgi:hypothetical protein